MSVKDVPVGARKLSARFVETVSSKGRRRDFRDAAVSGLQLRVSKGGVKTWTFRYRRKSDGRLQRVTLDHYPAMKLEEARTKAKELIAAVAKGADPARGVAARKVAATFREVADDWKKRHGIPNKNGRTLADDTSMLNMHILPEIGEMRALEITKGDIIRMLDKVAAKRDARFPAEGKSVRRLTHRPNRVFNLTRSIFRWAVGRDLVPLDPSFGVKPPVKKEKPRERALSPDEISALWKVLGTAPERQRYGKDVARGEKILGSGDLSMTRLTAITLLLSLATGQRIGEVAGIAKAELDLNDAAPMWVVPGHRTKNGRPNRVPLSRFALRLVREAMTLAGESEWLFPAARGDGPIDPHAPTRALARSREAVGLSDFRVHDLRRTAATCMAELGVSPHTISLVLNHVSARTATVTGEVYVQYSYDREKREALDLWGARLEQLVGRNSAG